MNRTTPLASALRLQRAPIHGDRGRLDAHVRRLRVRLLTRALRRAAAAIAHHLRNARAAAEARALMQADPRVLRDIGLDPREAGAASALPARR